MGKIKFNLVLFLLFNLCSIIQLEETVNELNIEVLYYYVYNDNEIGKKGVLALKTSFYDENNIFDIMDIESNTVFKAFISKESQETYEINCRLVKFREEPLYIFCNIDENIPKGEYQIYFNSINFMYKNNIINIFSYGPSNFNKLDDEIPFLYSDVQNITVEDDSDSIEIKFNIIVYNNEKLVISKGNDRFNSVNNFDSYQKKNNELICNLSKNKLLEIMKSSNDSFEMAYIGNSYIPGVFDFVREFYINFNNVEKKDVFVGITKLLENQAGKGSFITYETNVTNIPNNLLGGKGFNLEFDSYDSLCFFRKYDNSPLLIICNIHHIGKNTFLKEIKNEIIFKEENIKYNFRIQPFNIKEIIYYNYKSFAIQFSYPEVLDFTKQDNLTIVYIIYPNSDYIPSLKLNKDAYELKCNREFIITLKCIVPKSHFKGKKSGYYSTIVSDKSIAYEIPPVKVILNESNESNNQNKPKSNTLAIILSVLGVIILLVAIFLLYLYLRKKNITKNDIEQGTSKEGLLSANELLS